MDTKGLTHIRSDAVALTEAQQRKTVSKVSWRLLPLLFLCYIIAYVDRINVGFAKLQLREALGVDEKVFGTVYGLGAGLFFIGYFIFEVPSNLILHRVGARMWIARIMILWGIISSCMMFIPNVTVFYLMRFLLGVAEAGFFPGVILYMTYWYTANERARTMASLAAAAVFAGIIGSPLSGSILKHLDGSHGLAGWQWLFLVEGIPAVLAGVLILLALPNGPKQTRWLTDTEKSWLLNRLLEDAAKAGTQVHHRLADAVKDRRVWLLCLIYFMLNIGNYGYEMWGPSIIKGFSKSSDDAMIGWLNAIPYIVTMFVMLIVGWHSDRTGERRWHVAIASFSSAIGFVLTARFTGTPSVALIAMILALLGIKCVIGPFWALTTTFLSGTAAAGGIAIINSTGNLGGFVGSYLVGNIKDRTGSDSTALLILAAAPLLMGLLALTVRIGRSRKS
jgi:MFS transporter, ACS family, tartrate transporter